MKHDDPGLPLILTGEEFRVALAERCRRPGGPALIASAFITETAMRWLLEHMNGTNSVDFVARWAMHDMASGASDFESYRLARAANHRFFVDQSLHTKAYLFGEDTVFVGSANLTSKGLGLECKGNQEHVTLMRPHIRDVQKLSALVEQATELSDDLVAEMEKAVVNGPRGAVRWPEHIQIALTRPVRGLWVNDLPLSPPPGGTLTSRTSIRVDALGILSDGGGASVAADARELFLTSKAWTWLWGILRTYGELRFGRVTALLHESLLDDPAPYRRSVKNLVELLFQWVEFAAADRVQIIQHRHTRSLRVL